MTVQPEVQPEEGNPTRLNPVNGRMTQFDRSQQGTRFRRTVMAKMDELFRGKTWDIERTITLPEGQVFLTVFGRPCRSGYIIRCRETGERHAVGYKTLRHIHQLYLGVNLPRRLRPKIIDDRSEGDAES